MVCFDGSIQSEQLLRLSRKCRYLVTIQFQIWRKPSKMTFRRVVVGHDLGSSEQEIVFIEGSLINSCGENSFRLNAPAEVRSGWRCERSSRVRNPGQTGSGLGVCPSLINPWGALVLVWSQIWARNCRLLSAEVFLKTNIFLEFPVDF